MDRDAVSRMLAEPFAFALLQWPPLLALLHFSGDGGGWLALRFAAVALLALALLGAYGGGRGLGFGNAMLAAAGCVAAAWWAWPTGWAALGLVLLGLVMLSAQQLRLRRTGPPPIPGPVDAGPSLGV
jgi:hypothetical protein